LTTDSYVPVYDIFHRGEWITWVSGGEGALEIYYTGAHKNHRSINSYSL
jgi:hypothetical protein